MAEQGSWPGIRRLGLLSTSALLDLFEISGEVRYELESQQRRESKLIEHPTYGEAVIRDQQPLGVGVTNFLDGISLREYYELLNRKTFFWVRKERLVSLLTADAYKGKTHDVLIVDTKGFVERHQDEITLSHINSGAFFGSGRRGASTFQRIRDYPYEKWAKKKRKDAVVELAVDYAVKDISEFTIRVEEWTGTKPTGVIWDRGS